MTEEEVDPVLSLLPWYLSGTLTTAEADLVRERLEQSAEARRELDRLISLRHELDGFFEEDAEPSPRLRAEVDRRIGLQSATSDAGGQAGPQEPGWLGRVARSVQALFAPQWVPTAALALIVAQFGWLAGTRLNPADTAVPQVQTRSVESPRSRFRVVFRQDAGQAAVAGLLQGARARIVDGPDAEGSWVIEIRSIETQRINELLELGSTHPDLVLSIRTADP